MRTLILMRHAKAEAFNNGGDKARRLLPRGIADAQQMGQALTHHDLQLALVSSAVRTQETFQALGLSPEVRYLDRIYSAGSDDLRWLISEVSDTVSGLLLVGHAPSVPGLAAELAQLSGTGIDDFYHFPTACYATFHFTGSWTSIADEPIEGLQFAGLNRLL